MQTFELEFIAKVPFMTDTTEDKEAFALEWIKETYPEFYAVEVQNVKEEDKN